jgi:hypothetical protein
MIPQQSIKLLPENTLGVDIVPSPFLIFATMETNDTPRAYRGGCNGEFINFE